MWGRFCPTHDFTVHEPPEVADLDLPAPRVGVPDSLALIASLDVADRAAHAHGKAFRDVVRNLEGDVSHAPDVVLRPRSEQDVVDALDWASAAGVAVVPFGGGSSVVGGIEPRFDGPAVSLDLTRLDQVLEIDPVSRAARVQAGVLGPALRGPAAPARADAAALPAVVRALHAGRVARHPRRRPLRHACSPTSTT